MMLRLPFLGDSEIQAKAKPWHAALIQEGVGAEQGGRADPRTLGTWGRLTQA